MESTFPFYETAPSISASIRADSDPFPTFKGRMLDAATAQNSNVRNVRGGTENIGIGTQFFKSELTIMWIPPDSFHHILSITASFCLVTKSNIDQSISCKYPWLEAEARRKSWKPLIWSLQVHKINLPWQQWCAELHNVQKTWAPCYKRGPSWIGPVLD